MVMRKEAFVGVLGAGRGGRLWVGVLHVVHHGGNPKEGGSRLYLCDLRLIYGGRCLHDQGR